MKKIRLVVMTLCNLTTKKIKTLISLLLTFFFHSNSYAASCIEIRFNGNLRLDETTPIESCSTFVVVTADEFRELGTLAISITPEWLNGMLSLGFVLPVIATIAGMWVGTLFGAILNARKL